MSGSGLETDAGLAATDVLSTSGNTLEKEVVAGRRSGCRDGGARNDREIHASVFPNVCVAATPDGDRLSRAGPPTAFVGSGPAFVDALTGMCQFQNLTHPRFFARIEAFFPPKQYPAAPSLPILPAATLRSGALPSAAGFVAATPLRRCLPDSRSCLPGAVSPPQSSARSCRPCVRKTFLPLKPP